MKIICVEEHVTDEGLTKAGQPRLHSQAPYFAEVGSSFPGKLSDGDDKRPMQLGFQISGKLLPDMGAGRLEQMDRHGIDMQVLSCSNPPQDTPAAQEVELTYKANDLIAEGVHRNPKRFAAFASLPWQHPEAAAKELERAVKQLGFVGSILMGHPGDTFLDDLKFEPVLAKSSELGVPIYIHPGYPLPQVQQPYYGGLGTQVSARLSLFGWGWHNEAGVQLLRLLMSKAFDRHKQLQVISGHWGEMVPFYLQRLDDAIPQEVTGLSRTITETFKQHVSVTPSGMLNLPHFKFIHEVLGADRILFSVDYPYLTLAGARRFVETLPVSQEDKEKIAHGNVEALLGGRI